MADAIKLVTLGTPTELAKELARQIGAAASDASVANKPEVKALTAESTAADIVAALKA